MKRIAVLGALLAALVVGLTASSASAVPPPDCAPAQAEVNRSLSVASDPNRPQADEAHLEDGALCGSEVIIGPIR